MYLFPFIFVVVVAVVVLCCLFHFLHNNSGSGSGRARQTTTSARARVLPEQEAIPRCSSPSHFVVNDKERYKHIAPHMLPSVSCERGK
jgi:hypothetical protein